MSSVNDAKEIAHATESPVAHVMANALGVQEDTTERIRMIQRLIVEIVRETVPSESDQFDVRYEAHVSVAIIRLPSGILRLE